MRKSWAPGDPHLSAEIQSERLEAGALGLAPLRLEEAPPWDPQHEYWGDQGEPIPRWAKPIIARGPRPSFEMEMLIPGWDFEDPEEDPIGIAADLIHVRRLADARSLLMRLCEMDLRCLDAHAHLGNLEFDRAPVLASRHYQAGLSIGQLSLPPDFNGVLSWGVIGNRPFLRCLHGYGLSLWRVRNFERANEVFQRMLWLNPSDNQGVRFLIPDVKKRVAWEERSEP